LNEIWWEPLEQTLSGAADDAQLLAPYEQTRPGVEKFHTEAGFFRQPAEACGTVYLWDIWEKPKEPADESPEHRQINRMQEGLGRLDDESRFIRMQIACFNRCWYRFPHNVDIILQGIAAGHANLDEHVSCEPPWFQFVEILRHRRRHPAARRKGRYCLPTDGYPVIAPRPQLARAYMTILTWWSFGGHVELLKLEMPQHSELAETIYRRLGPRDPLKRLYVEKLRITLGHEAFPPVRHEGKNLLAMWDEQIAKELAGRPDPLKDLVGEENLCSHAWFRHIDHQIAAIGAGKRVRLPGSGEERTRVHAAVTDYVHALGSWLAGRAPEAAAEIWPAGRETVFHVYGLLGEATPVKRWLTACLWQKLRENQAHHGRGPLDEKPELFALPAAALAP
jgi:hypothetical protein